MTQLRESGEGKEYMHLHVYMYMHICMYIVPPVAAPLFLWKKKELSSGVVACICLVSITDYSCMLTLCM